MSAAADQAFALLQRLLPQHALARSVHRLARVRTPWVKNALIRGFVRAYGVDMRDAVLQDPAAYPSFNAFFTRALVPGARPLPAAAESLACPVDGTVSAAGVIEGERLLQAKGRSYTLSALLAGDGGCAERFRGGHYVTLYLAPRDYHRIHMASAGTLEEMRYVPGRLYSVNARTERAVPGLYARNERVVCLFDTTAGSMALVLVGALIVGSIETVWHGEVRRAGRGVERWRYAGDVRLERGAELGRFNVGSTVILLCARGRVEWDRTLGAGLRVRQGQPLGRCL